MTSFEEIQKQIADLQEQAETVRKKEKAQAVDEVKRLIAVYKLTNADIGLIGRRRSPSGVRKDSVDKRTKVVPKYRDPVSGETWSGRGKAPAWLAEKIAAGMSIQSFRISTPE